MLGGDAVRIIKYEVRFTFLMRNCDVWKLKGRGGRWLRWGWRYVRGGVRGAVVVSRVNIHHEVSVAPKNALREDFYFHA